MYIKLYVKHIIFLCLLVTAVPLTAQYYSAASQTTQHYFVGSIGVGEANNLFYNESVKPLLGAGGNIRLAYEVHHKRFLVGFGIGAGYQFTRQSVLNLVDVEERTDKNGEMVEYGYVYNDFIDKNHNIRISVPLYFGCEFTRYLYGLLGADIAFPVFSRYETEAQMLTQGTYAWSVIPTRSVGPNDFSPLGYYPEMTYSTKDKYKENMMVGFLCELGTYVPLSTKNKKTRLRIGAYANYSIRLGEKLSKPLTDYSLVDNNPHTQSMANLQNALLFNTILHSDHINRLAHNLEVGVRVTLLADITRKKEMCHCSK